MLYCGGCGREGLGHRKESPQVAITINEPMVEAITDAEAYAMGRTIFPAVTRHGAEVIAEAIGWAEAVLRDKQDGPARDLLVDTLDVLQEAAREF